MVRRIAGESQKPGEECVREEGAIGLHFAVRSTKMRTEDVMLTLAKTSLLTLLGTFSIFVLEGPL